MILTMFCIFLLWIPDLQMSCRDLTRWASYPIRKIVGCACTENAGVRRYFHPHDIFTPGWNIVTTFSPPLRYFHPLIINNRKSFCSQISSNFFMCIYNKGPFFNTFYDFLQIFVHHRLLIQSINISTKTNSKEGIMLKNNHFNPPSFMGWIYGYE